MLFEKNPIMIQNLVSTTFFKTKNFTNALLTESLCHEIIILNFTFTYSTKYFSYLEQVEGQAL